MHGIRLRYYLYIAVGVAALVMMLIDPELRAASRIGALFQSVSALSREVFAALH